MKKLIILFVMLTMVSTSLKAQYRKQDKVSFQQGFGITYYINSGINIYDSRDKMNGLSAHKGKFECKYQMRLKYKNFFMVSNTSLFMNKSDGFQFAPRFADFKIDLGYKLGKFKLSIGHQCLHAIEVQDTRPEFNEDRISGGYNRIKLTYNIID